VESEVLDGDGLRDGVRESNRDCLIAVGLEAEGDGRHGELVGLVPLGGGDPLRGHGNLLEHLCVAHVITCVDQLY